MLGLVIPFIVAGGACSDPPTQSRIEPPPPPPQAVPEPVFTAGTDSLVLTDDFNAYTSISGGTSPFIARYPDYRAYQRRTSRQIPRFPGRA